jgi:hypothetical protein
MQNNRRLSYNMKEEQEIPSADVAPKLPKALNDAFDAYFDENSNADMWQRFDMLSRAIVEYRSFLLNRHRKTGKKRLDEEDLFLFDCNEQLKHIEKILMTAKKLGRIGAPPSDGWEDKEWLKRVKESTTMGSIVRDMKGKTA